MRHAFSSVVLTLALAAACGGRTPRSPKATVQAFLEAMDRASSDHAALAQAYDLLAADARGALAERADKARVLAGRSLEPWEMLVQGRFRLRFAPVTMTQRVQGDNAVVVVMGRGSDERAEVPLIREDGRWKLALEIGPAAEAHGAATTAD